MKLWRPSKEPGFISRHIAILKARGINVRETIPANKRKAARASIKNAQKAIGKRKR